MAASRVGSILKVHSIFSWIDRRDTITLKSPYLLDLFYEILDVDPQSGELFEDALNPHPGSWHRLYRLTTTN